MRLLLAAGTIAVTMPAAGFAARTQVFEFSSGQINADWTGNGPIHMQKAEDGIVLTTGNGTGYLLAETAFFPEGGRVTATSTNGLRISFAWRLENEMLRQNFDVPLLIPAGRQSSGIFSMREAEDWPGATRLMGLQLPPNTSMLLHKIELYDWNIWEQWWAAERSFWVFDEYRPYSINFVWGPQIGWNDVERVQLYDFLPPIYTSGTFFTYGLVALVCLVLVVWAMARVPRETRKQWILIRAGAMLAVLWLVFDLRMGGEFLSWVGRDHTTFVAGGEMREFRDRGRFYDFAAFAADKVQDRASYIFFAEQPWPYLGNMRYLTYPATPGIDIENDDTWVIYNRPDIGVNEAGQLTVEGEAVTPPGTVLGRFDENSFIFRSPPLSAS